MSKTIRTSDGNVHIDQITFKTDENPFMTLPTGDLLNRPDNPVEGSIRYNTALHNPEWFDGNNWQNIGPLTSLGVLTTPASASAPGSAGQICFDGDYIYVCVAENTWKRSLLSTWP